MSEIRKLLVANRGEIAIRVFRSAHELGLRTVAIYSHEDRFAMHRLKADEAYQIGKPGEPIRSYLNIDAIIALAREKEVEAIHPGYGFLSENAGFARACEAAGITFVGPRPELLDVLGDKVAARKMAQAAGVPVLSGSAEPVLPGPEAHALAQSLGYPVIVKASMGGGGRGMRVVESADGLDAAIDQARREAGTAFGIPDVFLEKFIRKAKHIEVQLLGDRHGHLVHLYERDCSVQRRHQKIIEIAPAYNLEPTLRQAICDAAVRIGRYVRYDNAGTVEFLVDIDTGSFFFIEVNPRIQVEHTVTEIVTGIDLIKSQILVAKGVPLSDPEINLPSQDSVRALGYAFQCRVTTEDPANKFTPDYGRITHYRSPGGLGLRLDGGTAITGAIITPFYDSLLVKISASGNRFIDAARRMERALQEFRVRGVKTNVPFMLNVVTHPDFLAGRCTTRFIDETPELFRFPVRQDRATKLLTFAAEVTVNGFPGVSRPAQYTTESEPSPPAYNQTTPPPEGSRQLFKNLGPEAFARWIREQTPLLLTDTTFRDAHQSLLATRVRTRDMLRVGEAYARICPKVFSIEMWGGATFDTAMRFLKEDPWERLAQLREKIPNILFQMLLRGSNAVGYTSYPDNVVQAFVKESADAGIDLFRVFDALNWVPNMEVALEAVRDAGALCEAAICYTGDILDPKRTKYSLSYYVELARELEKRGANLIAIKDMSGLCKPIAAERLIKALREEVGVPIHFHTHDIGGAQAASVLRGADVGLDIADGAVASMSGLTSQPSLNAIVEALRFSPRETGVDPMALIEISRYWEQARNLYAPFESGLRASSAEVYAYEMPGGQYSNLFQQAKALGLASRWPEVCKAYADVNILFGDIVKVTPTSKVVGDMALFLVANNLTPDDTLDPERELAFPESVVGLFEGQLGQPPGGFPKALQERVLRGRPASTDRPGKNLPPADIAAAREKVTALLGRPATDRDALSLLLYPRVFPDLAAHERSYSDTSILPTPMFFHGPEPAVENLVEIEPGKTLIVKLLAVGEPHADGKRTVFFELNGQPREVEVVDRSLASAVRETPKADPNDPNQIAAPLPGLVVGVAVETGAPVRKGQKLLSIEAMKMETTLYAERPGRVAEVLTHVGHQVKTGELLIKMTSETWQAIDPMGWPFVRTLIHHETLASTSDLARALAADEALALPLAVRADRQTRGRGRGTHAWWSDPGSLTFTLVLDPAAHGLRPEHEPRLALASAVAVIDAVTEEFLRASHHSHSSPYEGGVGGGALGDSKPRQATPPNPPFVRGGALGETLQVVDAGSLGIRWPNDIEAAGRKLGGILPERVETPIGPRLLIGIGLNVLTRLTDAPEDVRRLAVALTDLRRDPMPPDALDRAFNAILKRFEFELNRLAADDRSLAERWENLDLLRDRWFRVDLGTRIIAGLGRGIDPEGALLVANERETVRLFGGQVLRGD